MNEKHAKRIRRQARWLIAAGEKQGMAEQPRGLRYYKTNKQNGYALPAGWVRERFARLIAYAPKSEWAISALAQAEPTFAHTARNVQGSFRSIMRHLKRMSKRDRTQAAN